MSSSPDLRIDPAEHSLWFAVRRLANRRTTGYVPSTSVIEMPRSRSDLPRARSEWRVIGAVVRDHVVLRSYIAERRWIAMPYHGARVACTNFPYFNYLAAIGCSPIHPRVAVNAAKDCHAKFVQIATSSQAVRDQFAVNFLLAAIQACQRNLARNRKVVGRLSGQPLHRRRQLVVLSLDGARSPPCALLATIPLAMCGTALVDKTVGRRSIKPGAIRGGSPS